MGVVKLSTAGILDYSKTSNFLSGNTPPAGPAFNLLETQVLTTNHASIAFDSLGTYAADYKHLQIRATLKDDRSASNSSQYGFTFNGVTSASYFLRARGLLRL